MLSCRARKRIRIVSAVGVVCAMVGVAMLLSEREIIFPEVAALVVGMLIIDKRVWAVGRWPLVAVITLSSIVGLCISLYSPLSQPFNLAAAFVATALILTTTGTTFYPLISACMLPVLIGCESWIYPLSVFSIATILTLLQIFMEQQHLRAKLAPLPPRADASPAALASRWSALTAVVLTLALLAATFDAPYLIVPPLVVSLVEFSNSKGGFRNRPIQTLVLLSLCALVGGALQLYGYHTLHIPQTLVVGLIILFVFGIFELTGKYFAPAAAMAIIPTILPQSALATYPLQAAIGAAAMITASMIIFHGCLKWSRAQLYLCLTSARVRRILRNRQ